MPRGPAAPRRGPGRSRVARSPVTVCAVSSRGRATGSDFETRAGVPMANDRDFDFFIGHWRVHHRRLKQRLANNHEWAEFDGECTTKAVLGGHGNIDDNILNLPEGAYRAVTLRAFDPHTGQWA